MTGIKNVLIVNFNTQDLTDACIMSVNLHVPECNIYVFDNSNVSPFINTFDNVTVFDNTKGQIIDFNKWLEKYPKHKKSPEATKIHGSAKHCYTIEKCIEMIPDGFVLLDSDVLIKKDFSELYDEKYIYIAETHKQMGVNVIRVLPFICYINSKMCIENNVHFFDEEKMLGLYVTFNGEKYDTGAAFYLNAAKFPHKEIKYEDYVVHLKGGSWFDTHKNFTERVRKIQITVSPEKFLEIYRPLWDESCEYDIDENVAKSLLSAGPKEKPILTSTAKERLSIFREARKNINRQRDRK